MKGEKKKQFVVVFLKGRHVINLHSLKLLIQKSNREGTNLQPKPGTEAP